MRRLRLASVLGLLVACGLANPVAKHPDGTIPRARTRIGVASVQLVGDCGGYDRCTVQLSMAHAGSRAVHAQVVAARVIVDDVDLGEVPVSGVMAWHHGSYRDWNHLVWPFRTTKLSVELGRFEWEEQLDARGLADYRENVRIELELSIDGETVLVQPMFAVQRLPSESERLRIVT
jgi:hypothetical protein